MIPEGTTLASGTRFLLTAACLIVFLAGLKAAEPFLVPLVFAAFLAVMSAPLVLWLRNHRVPPAVGVPLVVVAVLGALSLLGLLVGGSINSFVANAPQYRERLDVLFGDAYEWLQVRGIELSQERLRSMIDPSAAIDVVGGTLTSLAAMLSNALLVLLTMAFILFEVTELPAKIRAAAGDPTVDLTRYEKVATEVKQYVLIKTYVSAGTGVLVGLALWIIGVDFPLLWGLLAFLLNYIPNIGSIIAAIPPVLLALVQFGVARAIATLAVFVVVNTVVGNVVEPAFMGRRLGLSSLVVFLSLLFWGYLWGTMGMLLSVPLTMIVKIMLEHSGQFRWLAVLMGGTPSVSDLGPPPREEPTTSE